MLAEEELKRQLEDESQWLQNRFKNPSKYQARLVASLAALPARQWHGEEADWFPAVDILENGESICSRWTCQILTQEAFQVYVENGVLSIIGVRTTTYGTMQPLRIERPCGPFVRRFALPDDASQMEICATLKDGVLELYVRKMPAGDGNVKPYQDHIEVGIEPSN